MSLSKLIRKKGAGHLATAIPAISATQSTQGVETVARIATVAVANSMEPASAETGAQIEQPETTEEGDDRITCQQCTNLYATGTCLAARRLQIKRAGMVYAPIRNILRRCEGYKPKLSDPDQRQGRERWPSLASE